MEVTIMTQNIIPQVSEFVTRWALWGINATTSGLSGAEQNLHEDATGLMNDYSKNSSVDAEKIQRAFEHAMEPLKTLILASATCYGASYVLSTYAPIVSPLFSLINKVVIWVGAELLISYYHINRTSIFFEQRAVEKTPVAWDDFVNHVNDCSHRILASTFLISHASFLRKDLLNVGDFLNQLKENEANKDKKSWEEIVMDRLPGLSQALAIGKKVLETTIKSEEKDS